MLAAFLVLGAVFVLALKAVGAGEKNLSTSRLKAT
jgi:hypothetical protein